MTPSAAHEQVTVGVFPPAALARRRRLFAALERAYDVRFQAREAGQWRDAQAAVLFLDEPGGEGAVDEAAGDTLLGQPPAGLPILVAGAEEGPAGAGVAIGMSSDAALDRRLRGQVLHDRHAGRAVRLPLASAEGILARRGEDPVWAASGPGASEIRAALAPTELAAGETLRERVAAGRFLALAPLVMLLRAVTAPRGWQAPPLRAAVIVDDPNLHWPTYGYIDFAAMARHADEHDYHVAFAMVPLDAWFAHPRAVRLFSEHRRRLSLLMHGNDHTFCELGQARDRSARAALLDQAIRRVRSFEQRTGLEVSRVMAPPHGDCSEEMLEAMLATEIEAACISRPYPWLDAPPADATLAQFFGADLVAGGLPVLPRYQLARPREDVVWRAFLDQPVILYGHHGDFAAGLDTLGDLAALVNRLGPTSWQSLAEIAATNASTRQHDGQLHVRVGARRVAVSVPAGAREIVAWPWGGELEPGTRFALRPRGGAGDANAGRSAEPGEPLELPADTREVEVVALRADSIRPHPGPTPGPRPWPILRRVLVESRDRARPLRGRR